jgi:Condensation domain
MRHNPSIERPLGFLEWVFWLIEQVGSVNFVVAAEVAGPLTPEVLRSALDAVQAQQPLLRARVAMGPRNRLWFRSDNVGCVPLRVCDAAADDWIIEAELERETPFQTDTGPLCRCTLLQHGDNRATLLTTINHMIGDGVSGLFLVGSILQAAGANCGGRAHQFDRPALGRAMDDHLPRWTKRWPGVGTAFRAGLSDRALRRRLGKADAIPVDGSAPLGGRRNRVIPVELDPDTTRRLFAKAREEKCSLHGILAAAQMRAIAREFNRDGVTQSLATGTSVRGRIERKVSNDELGLFASVVESLHRIDPAESLWALAHDVQRAVARKVAAGADLRAVAKRATMQAALRWWLQPGEQGRRRFERMLARRSPPTSMISVIPRGEQIARATDYGPLSVESLRGFGGGPRTPLFSMSTVSHGRLHWNFVYLEPILSRLRAQRIADRAILEVQQAIGERQASALLV